MLKRLVDFLVSLILLIIISPLFVVIIILVKFSSNGPIIFQQKRIGLNNKEFTIYKFRTMHFEAPKNMPTHLLEDADKFITPIGCFLRKSSFDELPQLFNIIKGEMSFVGPRPALFNQYDLISLRNENKIHKIRPGITGWAQINGRDELEIPQKIEYDRFYLEHRSLFLDFKIIILTFTKVIFGKGVVEGKQKTETNNVNNCL